jgi:hypothetical protein
MIVRIITSIMPQSFRGHSGVTICGRYKRMGLIKLARINSELCVLHKSIFTSRTEQL